MTIAVACNLAEGVVLGVDSAVTLTNDNGDVVKTYEHAAKLFQLGDKPIGIATYGLSALGSRIIGSYIRQFVVENPQEVVTQDVTVKDVVEQLRIFFLEQYKETVVPVMESREGKKFKDIAIDKIPLLGFPVGGFSAGKYLSEIWEIRIPFDKTPYSAKLWFGEGDFRPAWFSLNDSIVRYQLGCDRNLITEVKQYIAQLRGSPLTDAENANFETILKRYEFVIPFDGMPMEEGIAYVKFVVEMVINHYRFAVGAPVVGGKAQIGVVTYKGEKFHFLEKEE